MLQLISVVAFCALWPTTMIGLAIAAAMYFGGMDFSHAAYDWGLEAGLITLFLLIVNWKEIFMSVSKTLGFGTDPTKYWHEQQ